MRKFGPKKSQLAQNTLRTRGWDRRLVAAGRRRQRYTSNNYLDYEEGGIEA